MRNLSPAAYVDPGCFTAEQTQLFSTTWQLMAHSDQLKNPGDYIAGDIAGIAVFLLHGKDGITRGFRNVCRHRGARLLEPGVGQCRKLKCPYHHWIYSDQGLLEHAPWFGEPEEIIREEWPLLELPVQQWRGLLFICLEPQQSFTKQLGTTDEELADTPIDDYHLHRTEVLEFDANWKVYTDNFVEGYHIPGIHPKFFQAIDFKKFETTAHDGLVRMTAPARRDLFYQGRWYWMWPNWTLSLFAGGMNTSRINPVSANRTQLIYSFYFSDASTQTESQRNDVVERNLEVVHEDFSVCLATQQNYATGNYSAGPLSPRHEQGVHYFQQRWKDLMDWHD